MCRPRARPAAASLAASLPAYGSPGDTPVGRREWRLVGLEQAPAWGGGEALHVRRAGASPPLPRPTRRRLHCSQSLSELPPRPSKPSTAHAWTSGSFVRSFHRRRWASGLPRRQAVLSVGPKPDLGAGATDQGLTGTWGNWRQGDPGVHREAWWVPDTGAQVGSGCGQRREGLLPYSSRPRTCWGRLVREVEELEAATLGGEPPSGPSLLTWGGWCDGGNSQLATESSGARTRGRVALPLQGEGEPQGSGEQAGGPGATPQPRAVSVHRPRPWDQYWVVGVFPPNQRATRPSGKPFAESATEVPVLRCLFTQSGCRGGLRRRQL